MESQQLRMLIAGGGPAVELTGVNSQQAAIS
jgi:hypothetical protein